MVPTAARVDLLTAIGIAALVVSLGNVVHEGIGHGGACVLTGCDPQLLTSMTFTGEREEASELARRLIPAGGTIANLLAAVIALLWLRLTPPSAHARWYFLWLLSTLSLLEAAGYLLFSGLGNFGDWAVVVRGWQPPWLWRAGLAIAGGVAYWFIADWSMKRLAARIPGTGAARLPTAYMLTLSAYATIAVVRIGAGLLDPHGVKVLLIAAVASSLGGASALAWGPQLLRNPKDGVFAGEALQLDRDWRWIGTGLLAAALFIGVLGPGIAL